MTTNEPLTDTVIGTSKATGLSKSTLYRAIAAGDLPTIKIGRRTLILRSDRDAFLERFRVVKAAA